jgi:predicted nucleic acid-binding protein
MIYLLSTQCLLDILTAEPDITKWMKDKPAQSVEVSSVSIGQAYIEIAKVGDVAFRKQLEGDFEKILLTLQAYQGIVPFEGNAPKVWATLASMTLMHDQTRELSPESRMVVATALTRNATLVDKPRPYHAQLPTLKVQSP